jgi:hypothetical protein
LSKVCQSSSPHLPFATVECILLEGNHEKRKAQASVAIQARWNRRIEAVTENRNGERSDLMAEISKLRAEKVMPHWIL